MSEPVLWSAINISEGKDLEKLKILALCLEKKGACLADWSADPDHNRAVFSLVGSPSELEESIPEIYSWALEHLDLSEHQGEHPRLGLVDVVPFVPLNRTADIEIARSTAEKIASNTAKKFNISVFLYRDSSGPDQPITLQVLRRGGPKRLAERMASGELTPNFGPREFNPRTGVTVMGARSKLVAFNCVLNTQDLTLGKEIAREIRASSGGIPHLQALAFVLGSQDKAVQISMNLVKPDETPPHLAYLAVVEAAQKRGLTVTSSELIGLVPMKALQDAFCHFLQMDHLQPTRIAEWNLLGREQSL